MQRENTNSVKHEFTSAPQRSRNNFGGFFNATGFPWRGKKKNRSGILSQIIFLAVNKKAASIDR